MHLRVLRFAALIVPVLLLGTMSLSSARAQDDNELAQLLLDGMRLYSQGEYAKALPLAERSVARARTRHGEKGMEFATAASLLGMVYQAQGRYAAAEPLHRHALAIYETTLGREHSVVTTPLNALASLYEDQGRYAEAEPLYKRSLAIKERALGRDDPSVATSLNNLAHLYMRQGRYADAEPVFKRSLAIRESTLRRDHPSAGTGKNFDDLAVISRDIDRDAVPRALNNLAQLYGAQGRYAEAEPLLKRSLAMDEAALGRDHPSVATGLNNLAGHYVAQGRYDDAEPLYRRSLAIREKALGREHLDVAASLNNMATLYSNQRRYADAEPLLKRSLAVFESALGRDHPSVATNLSNLASLYDDQGRYAEAEPLLKRSLAIRESALGREHPDVATSLNNLAGLYVALGRHTDAEPLYKSSLAIREKALGPDHPEVATSLNNLAFVALAQRDWGRAADYWRRAIGVIERRTLRGVAGVAEGSSKGEAQRSSWYFVGVVQTTHHLATERRASSVPAAEMFETAQWALASEAAASLAQMAARSAAGSPELAGLVRERQDLMGEWQTKDKLLIAAKGQEPGKGSATAERALADRIDAIDARLAEIGRKLAKDFPDHAALASPAPASVTEVQTQLGTDEALVLFLDTNNRFKPLPEGTFVWVVTKSEVRWVRSALGTEALKREVAALRCGLDAALWEDATKSKACTSMLNRREHADGGLYGNVVPFDLQRSHALYKGLLGEVEDLIAGKQLLIVPSGALTQLPFQVLVTEPPKTSVPVESEGYRDAAWLGARQPITVLPAVSSLKALRAHARPSLAGKAYLGIGNPLLDGRPTDPNDVARAKLARAKQTCATTPVKAATVGAARGGVAGVVTHGGLADVARLKNQTPLPETADELCAVSRDLHADDSAMRLGARATEAEVKRLSVGGELARYRVLHFATHGVMAGELDKDREPGLILTPPDKVSEQDDGYLSASEIAGLKLDADWVILSACNTAAGGAASAEALSGIARAFIYAGARALLVSHWAVYSDAAVKLITKAAAEMAGDASVGRAEAMRRAMAALIEHGAAQEAHPAYWAPFVVVGEGATAPQR